MLLLAIIAGCGTHDAMRKPAERQPATPKPRLQAAPPVPPASPGRNAASCNPRVAGPDRGRVGLGLLAGDCADDAGRNRTYVTRLVTVRGSPSPAQRAGVRVGDRVVSLDACEIPSSHDLATRLRNAPPGWVPQLVIERGGRELQILVPSIQLPDVAAPPGSPQLSTAGCRAIGRQPAK
jgi:hypothetical protein